MYSTWGNVVLSLKQAWKYKILWVFGILAFAQAAGVNGIGDLNGANKNVSRDKNSSVYDLRMKNSPKYRSGEKTPASPFLNNNIKPSGNTGGSKFGKVLENGQKVLGLSAAQSTYSANTPGLPTQSLFASLLQFLVPIIISLIILIFLIAVAFLLGIWAQGSLVKASSIVVNNEGSLILRDLSIAGLGSARRLIKMLVFLILISLLILLILGVMTAMGAVWAKISLVLSLIIFSLISMTETYAVRFIVLKNLGTIESIKAGWKLVRLHFWKSVKLLLANLITMIVISVLIGLPILFLLLVISLPQVLLRIFVSGNGSNIVTPIIWIALAVSLVVVLFILIVSVLRGFTSSYQEISWTRLFVYLTKEETITEGNENAAK